MPVVEVESVDTTVYGTAPYLVSVLGGVGHGGITWNVAVVTVVTEIVFALMNNV